ncbi:hypothetical protein [Nocardia altamirensis]|uniref:hypothetical protein n=1 Tax=Nocardia altamirensis TaxID=472158 RepID=UPI000840603A|nr:hypothetical protein [Nocardia altamirensis]
MAAVRWRIAAACGLAALALVGLSDQVAARTLGSHDHELYPAVNLLANQPANHTGYAEAAKLIATRQRPNDGLVYGGRDFWLLDTGLAYYTRANPLPRDVFLAQTATERNDLFATECADYAACLTPQPPARLWMVMAGDQAGPYTVDPVTRAKPMPPDKVSALRDTYDVAETIRSPGMTIILLLVR